MYWSLYMALTVISSIVLTTLGFLLMGIHIPRNEQTDKLRTARVILSVSYFVLALPGFLEALSMEDHHSRIVASLTLVIAAFQSLLFTAMLLTLIRPTFVTRRKVWTQIGIVGAGASVFLIASLHLEAGGWIYLAASAACIMLYAHYTRVFRREYARSLADVEAYYDEDPHARLQWAKQSFCAALAMGGIALLSSGFSPTAYCVFTVLYTTFYVWFTARFSNYVLRLNCFLPAITPNTDGTDSVQATAMPHAGKEANKERLRIALEQWVADKGYLRLNEGREQIAEELGTTPTFLRWYFSTQMPQDFRSWRVGLRIEEAKRILVEEPGISLNTLAGRLGFPNRQNFYIHFKKLTGETPSKWYNSYMETKYTTE